MPPRPTVELIQPGFTTADASYPSITFERGDLVLSFVDWRDRYVNVTFRNVCRFEWSDEPDDHFEGEPHDGSCVVRNSRWIPRVAETSSKHFRVNFNASGGRLDIACPGFEINESQGR
jgi:hypothetical protein